MPATCAVWNSSKCTQVVNLRAFCGFFTMLNCRKWFYINCLFKLIEVKKGDLLGDNTIIYEWQVRRANRHTQIGMMRRG